MIKFFGYFLAGLVLIPITGFFVTVPLYFYIYDLLGKIIYQGFDAGWYSHSDTGWYVGGVASFIIWVLVFFFWSRHKQLTNSKSSSTAVVPTGVSILRSLIYIIMGGIVGVGLLLVLIGYLLSKMTFF